MKNRQLRNIKKNNPKLLKETWVQKKQRLTEEEEEEENRKLDNAVVRKKQTMFCEDGEVITEVKSERNE